MVTKYVLGFLFNKDKSKVVLIQKKRPQWQAGKFNGVGGKVEACESDIAAMVREFKEQTGVSTNLIDWKIKATLSGQDAAKPGNYRMQVYTACNEKYFHAVQSETDEQVFPLPVGYILNNPFGYLNTTPNLKWLIGMCLDESVAYSRIETI